MIVYKLKPLWDAIFQYAVRTGHMQITQSPKLQYIWVPRVPLQALTHSLRGCKWWLAPQHKGSWGSIMQRMMFIESLATTSCLF